ncbi:TetR family transcriptional regulator [Planobispora longispora]|uniref:TetR family transcriptional regulator n=1 Tax=Planobispora longispora TaxID=28887 RepID=A0A8J3RI02_9ACTN|nr:TetR family transcriptional regulator [Planobispora longispora]GIH76087.1 TetR family transcriptional regulator [Planobispora longispora]
MTEQTKRSGRRRGNGESPQTREAILEAALGAFEEKGYGGTTIRGVAAAAGVDPALVMHFFGTKDGLFDAAIRGPGMPLRRLREVIDAGPPGELGERLIRRYLSLWDDPATAPRLRAVVQAATSTPAAGQILKDFMVAEVLRPLAEHLGSDDGETRAALVASQMIGVALTRYLLHVEPMVALSAEQVAAALAPAVQHYLTGDLSL